MLTLDYANYFIELFINPTIDYGVYSTNKNFPKISKVIGFFIAKKWQEKKNQLVQEISDKIKIESLNKSLERNFGISRKINKRIFL